MLAALTPTSTSPSSLPSKSRARPVSRNSPSSHRLSFPAKKELKGHCKQRSLRAMEGTSETPKNSKRSELEESYGRMQTKMFSKVPEMSVEELRRLLDLREKSSGSESQSVADSEAEKEGAEKVVVVDVRTQPEIDVSALPESISQKAFEGSIDKYRDHKIVCYCTIGFRSGMYAQDLVARGYDAYNLKGAILAWTHGGYDLINSQGKTNKVHVFNEKYQLQADGYEPVYFEKAPFFQVGWDFLKLKLPFWFRGVKSNDKQ